MLFEQIDGHELQLLKIAYDDFLAYWAGNKPALPALLAE